MTLLHPHHHPEEPFEHTDPEDDRWTLACKIGDLRRQVHRLEDELGRVRAENAHLRAQTEKGWWKRGW